MQEEVKEEGVKDKGKNWGRGVKERNWEGGDVEKRVREVN